MAPEEGDGMKEWLAGGESGVGAVMADWRRRGGGAVTMGSDDWQEAIFILFAHQKLILWVIEM